MNATGQAEQDFDPRGIERPDSALMRYFTIISLFALFAFPIVFLVHLFKYETLRYRFDDDGVSMSWGLLFRREINLTYRRIQDIHLTRNILQRWMGLATVSIQTASGSSTPEMQIEGILEYDALRDFLYRQMRGAKGETSPRSVTNAQNGEQGEPDQALALLMEIRDAMRALAEQRGAEPDRGASS